MHQSAKILTKAHLASQLNGDLRRAFAQILRPERHKYNVGHLLLIAGSPEMTGAMVLAAKAAARSGCGLVTVAHPAGANIQLNVAAPSVMTRVMDWHSPLQSIGSLSRFTAVAIGPGLGRTPDVADGVREIATQRDVPILALDADALWAISPVGNRGVSFDLQAIDAPLVLTPHLGEFKRLFATELANNVPLEEAALRFAQRATHHLILKQSATRIYSQSGCTLLDTPNGGLATGGSGDVLLGLLGGLLAWMPSVGIACQTAVLAHSIAGEVARSTLGELAMNASDLITHLGEAMRQLEGIFLPIQK